MKKIYAIFLIIICCVFLFGCQNKSSDRVENTVGFYNLFGENIDVVTKNVDFGNIKGEKNGQQTTYTFSCKENNEGITEKQLVFYNDILMAERNTFCNLEQAYTFAKKYRTDFEINYGKKDTYPGMSSDYSGYLDDITSVNQLSENYVYYEDYTVEVSDKKTHEPWLHADKAKEMIKDREFSRIDLRLELQVVSEDLAFVSVKYVVLR